MFLLGFLDGYLPGLLGLPGAVFFYCWLLSVTRTGAKCNGAVMGSYALLLSICFSACMIWVDASLLVWWVCLPGQCLRDGCCLFCGWGSLLTDGVLLTGILPAGSRRTFWNLSYPPALSADPRRVPGTSFLAFRIHRHRTGRPPGRSPAPPLWLFTSIGTVPADPRWVSGTSSETIFCPQSGFGGDCEAVVLSGMAMRRQENRVPVCIS